MLLPFAATIASMQHRMGPEYAKKCNFEILLFTLEIEINVSPKKKYIELSVWPMEGWKNFFY